MTGLPAALSALAFASTASVADSLMAAMRREIRRSAGGRADVGSVAETAVMGPWCQRRAVDDEAGRGRCRRRRERDPSSAATHPMGRWLCARAVPYTRSPGAVDPATGVPRNLSEARRCDGEAGRPGPRRALGV